MDHGYHEHLDSFLRDINWAYVAVLVGMFFGWIVWAARQMFSTKQHTERCRVDLLNELKAHEEREEKKMDEYKEQNTREHMSLNEDLKWIRNHLFKKNGDL